jgi:phosphoribosylformylglycinamidine synthase subunit PurQ / glutaminase
VSERPRIAVVTFPGSLDDGDMRLALDRLGADAVAVWHAETELPSGTAAVVLPGGFSYGDYLRCGAIASHAAVMGAVRAFAAAGAPVLGVCNGFQILCEARLLPGALRLNRRQEYVCRDVELVVEQDGQPFGADLRAGMTLSMPVKHGEGNWFADDALYAELEAGRQIVLRYAEDVNGSRGQVAGVRDARGNVVGMMPHPEHAVDPLLGPTGGAPILAGLVAAARERHAAPV